MVRFDVGVMVFAVRVVLTVRLVAVTVPRLSMTKASVPPAWSCIRLPVPDCLLTKMAVLFPDTA